MDISGHGLHDAIRRLADLERKAAELAGARSIRISELFPASFMIEHTNFGTIQEMLDASGFPASTTEEFAAIPDDEWDVFVSSRTKFPSWQAMLEAGTAHWVSSKLGS